MRTLHLHPVPPDLQHADARLQAYARWATFRHRRNRCGSAEGQYRPETALAAEDRRTPQMPGLTQAEVMQVQRAIATAPPAERTIIKVLYIEPTPAAAVRKLGLHPRDCPMLHARALRHVAAQLAR
ncbi:MAG: hypothetical protein MUE35_13485 [Hydrogenophaga sp.]|jgi:DNA-directed RNA polymerase specialized sigma24 family protein|nr:hypothetical protein [Hydrogenophaga sp.]